MASGTKGEEPQGHGTSTSSGEAGDSRLSRGGYIQQDSHSRDESIEYIGTLRKGIEEDSTLYPRPDLAKMVGGKSLRSLFRIFTECLGIKLGPDIGIMVGFWATSRA